MQVKRIKCPVCNTVLDVKNKNDEETIVITCPSCQTLLKVKFRRQQEPIEARTFYAAPRKATDDDDGKTRYDVGGNGATRLAKPMSKPTSKAILQVEGVNYTLEEGLNVVGRKSPSSKATVQLETTDRYMSRQHCRIIVSTLHDGSKKVVLSNYQNKNLITIEGIDIVNGDEIRLTDGDSIMMGHTTVTFKLS